MYAMRGNAHATFKFITLIFVIIVTMQEQTQKGKKAERVYDACHAYHMCVGDSKYKKKRQCILTYAPP